MSSLSKRERLFKELGSFLDATGKLDPTDSKIYLLALNKGVITSSDVTEEFSEIRQGSAVAHLKGLVKKGFLESISRETASKRPYAMNFKAVHPGLLSKKFWLELWHCLIYWSVMMNIGRC